MQRLLRNWKDSVEDSVLYNTYQTNLINLELKSTNLLNSQVDYSDNLKIYTGLQPQGTSPSSKSLSDVDLRLYQPIYQTERNVTGDNWFAIIPLMNELRRKDFSHVGTLKKNG